MNQFVVNNIQTEDGLESLIMWFGDMIRTDIEMDGLFSMPTERTDSLESQSPPWPHGPVWYRSLDDFDNPVAVEDGDIFIYQGNGKFKLSRSN